MFFPRLRRQAKWMFVLLALVFGVGFVAFGVGSDLPSGIGDIFRDAGRTTSGPSAAELRERIRENPNDDEAYRDLAAKLQQDGETDEAIAVLRRYARREPGDRNALSQLAGLYLAEANRFRTQANQAEADFVAASPGAFLPTLTGPTGEPVIGNAVTDPAAQEASNRYNTAIADLQAAYTGAIETYQRIARLDPRDPQAQLQLAQTAESGADFETAIAAYNRFLELVPEDQNAPVIRQRVRELERQLEQTRAAEADQASASR